MGRSCFASNTLDVSCRSNQWVLAFGLRHCFLKSIHWHSMRRGEVSEIQLYWERAAILFEQSLFLKQVWFQFRLSVRITSFLTIHERHRLILVSKYIYFERAELGFGVTELREGLEVSCWEVPSPPVEPCAIPEPVPDLDSWLNQIGQ